MEMRLWLLGQPWRFICGPRNCRRRTKPPKVALLRTLCTGLLLLIVSIVAASSAPRNVVLLFDERVDCRVCRCSARSSFAPGGQFGKAARNFS